MLDNTAQAIAEKLAHLLVLAGQRIVTAESCTGGGISHLLTGLAGSSQWFERGFVTYTDIAKQEMLSVSHDTLAAYGAVSEQTASAMAIGALLHSPADFSVAVTGIAGPGGGSEGKPVGTVCFGWGVRDHGAKTSSVLFAGDRQQVREQAILMAVQGLLEIVQGQA